MAVEMAAAYVPIMPEFGGIKSQLGKGLSGAVPIAQKTGRTMGSRMGGAIKSTLKTAAVGVGVTAGAAIGASLVGGFKSAIAQQDAKKVLTGLYGSAKGATAMMKDLRKVAGNSPIEYSAYLKAAQGLAYAGVKGDDAAKSLKNVGLAITAVGGTSEDMQGATDAVLKMVNAGKVTLDTVQQLSNTGVPIISGLAKHFGVSIDKVNTMASEGKIGLNDVLAVMKNGTGATFQSMIKAGKKASSSFGNQWKIAKDRVFTAVGKAMLPLMEKLAPVIGRAGTAVAGFATKVGKWLNGLNFSSWEGFVKSLKLGPAFDSIMGSLTTLKPAFRSFIDLMPALGAASGKLASAGLHLVVEGLRFLAKHVDTIVKYMPLLVAAFVAWRIAQRGVLAVQALSVPMMLVSNVLRLKAATTELRLAAATRTNTVATAQNNVAQRAGVVARTRAALAAGAQKVKLVATTVATKAATVAQRALNLAMRMNPIGIIITAITALVAGLVWFFTQTKLGKKIWSKVWSAIKVTVQVAWAFIKVKILNPLVRFFTVTVPQALRIIGKWFSTVWNGIENVVRIVWNWVKKNVLNPIKRYFTVIVPAALRLLGQWFNRIWNKIEDVARAVWNWVEKHVLKPIRRYFTVIVPAALEKLKGFFTRIWNKIESVLRTVWNWIEKHVLKPIKRYFTVIVPNALDKLRNAAERVWNKLKDVIRKPYNWIKKNVFDPLRDFITKKIPNAFERGLAGIKKIWDNLKNIAKKPVKFVVNTVINDGLIGTFNKIPGVDLPKIRLPKGFAKGGLAKGWAMVGEEGPELVNFTNPGRVYTAKQTGAALKHTEDGQAATRTGGGGGFGAIWGPFQNAIRNAGKLFVDSGAGPAWQIPAAASMWDRLAGLRVRGGRGYPQANTGIGPLGSILAWATGSGNITFNSGGMAPGLSPTMKRATAAHEIGHVLGLPHTGAASIMQPVMGKYMQPTAFDKRRLESLYGEGSRKPGGPVGPPPNPFAGLVDKLVDAIKERFPAGGMFIDAAVGLARAGIEKVKDWVGSFMDGIGKKIAGIAGNVVDGIKGFFGFAAKAPGTLYDNGGKVLPGTTLLDNQTRKPEALLNPIQWATAKKAVALAETKTSAGDTYYVQLPERATVNDLVGAVNFEQRRHARGGRR